MWMLEMLDKERIVTAIIRVHSSSVKRRLSASMPPEFVIRRVLARSDRADERAGAVGRVAGIDERASFAGV